MVDGAQVNRSISTVRTELEFLRDSNVLSPGQFQSIMAQLPGQNGQPSQYVDPRYNPNPQQQFNPVAMAQQAQNPDNPAHPQNPHYNPNPQQQFNPVAMAQQAQNPDNPAHPQNPHHHEWARNMAAKFGNAAMFGAGATFGGDMVNDALNKLL